MSQAETTPTQSPRAPTFHTAHGSRQPVTPPIDLALKRLGLIGRRRDMAALFGERVTRQAVINWRKGRRQTPAWAIAAVRTALRSQAESFLHLDALLAELEKRNANSGTKSV